MSETSLSCSRYRTLLSGGLACLKDNCDRINKLNVFPVPDGDTGDNMLLTLQSGLSETAEHSDLPTLCGELSKGMIYGARGNSGVILSRFFFGLNAALSSSGGPVTVSAFSAGLARGTEEAYAAVSCPKEGTILTVMHRTAEAVGKSGADDFETLFSVAVSEAAEALKQTPELLDVLKNAGVVDSGGAGFLCILEGMKNALEGKQTFAVASSKTSVRELTPDDEMLGYCTEFILQLMGGEPFSLDGFRTFLNEVGNSVAAFQIGAVVKVHVHTFTPEKVLAEAHRYGEFLTLKIENMTVMHSESTIENDFEIPTKKSRYGVVAVACGEGVKKMFEDGGCTVVDGGRSMNPSAGDILDGIRRANAETVFVFPNNKNVLLSALQAKETCDFCKVRVIPSEDIGHCYLALSYFDPEAGEEALAESFEKAKDLGRTVLVAQASRSCVENGVTVRAGDRLCFDSGKILAAGKDENEAAKAFFDALTDEPDVVIVLRGEDLPQERAEALERELSRRFPLAEIITVNGGQPIYDYIFLIR